MATFDVQARVILRETYLMTSGALQPTLQNISGRAHGCGDCAGEEGGDDLRWGVLTEAQHGAGEKVVLVEVYLLGGGRY